MRPQHITAENHVHAAVEILDGPSFNEAAAYHCGKPRDGTPSSRPIRRCFNEAAAYHCGKPSLIDPPHRRGDRGFNEAAAYHCGKPAGGPAAGSDRDARASMRPQHITAENLPKWSRIPGRHRCFNEAAAYHCGKPLRRAGAPATETSFNEAAAYHCGKPNTYCAGSWPTSCFNEAAAYHCGKPPVRGRPQCAAALLQ